MNPILALSLLLVSGGPTASPWEEIRLTIFRDPYTSSDQVTICRVRADNLGSRSWSGRALAFEARAIDRGEVVRQRGRFGLVLEPHGSLETLVALPGRHDRFEIVPLPAGKASDEPRRRSRGNAARHPPRRHRGKS